MTAIILNKDDRLTDINLVCSRQSVGKSENRKEKERKEKEIEGYEMNSINKIFKTSSPGSLVSAYFCKRRYIMT